MEQYAATKFNWGGGAILRFFPVNLFYIPYFPFYRLGKHQKYIKEKLGSKLDKPTFLVMHGGSGSSQEEIRTAVKNGVIKTNIDTDTQWAYWKGI